MSLSVNLGRLSCCNVLNKRTTRPTLFRVYGYEHHKICLTESQHFHVIVSVSFVDCHHQDKARVYSSVRILRHYSALS